MQSTRQQQVWLAYAWHGSFVCAVAVPGAARVAGAAVILAEPPAAAPAPPSTDAEPAPVACTFESLWGSSCCRRGRCCRSRLPLRSSRSAHPPSRPRRPQRSRHAPVTPRTHTLQATNLQEVRRGALADASCSHAGQELANRLKKRNAKDDAPDSKPAESVKPLPREDPEDAVCARPGIAALDTASDAKAGPARAGIGPKGARRAETRRQ